MKKPWLTACVVIFVAAIVVIGVLLGQANGLRKQTDELTAKVASLEKELVTAKETAADAKTAAEKAEAENAAVLEAVEKAEAEKAAALEAVEKAEAEKAAALEAAVKAEAEKAAALEAAEKAEVEKAAAVEAAEKAGAEKAAAEAASAAEAAEKAAAEKAAAAEAAEVAVAAAAEPLAIEAAAEPFVIKVGDTIISVAEAQAAFDEAYNYYNDYYLNYGMRLSAEEIGYIREEALNGLLTRTLMNLKVDELGLGEITEAQVAEYKAEADANFERGLTDIMNYYGYSRDEALEMLELNYGITPESELEMYLANIPYQRLVAYVTADVEVSQEAIEAEYAMYVESDKATYENDVATYELYTNYYGSQSMYLPTGYRYVKHILLEIPQEIAADLMDYQTDVSAVESVISVLTDELYALENETGEEEATQRRAPEEIQAELEAKKTELTALNEKVGALRARILPELQALIDEIMGKLADGASFESLVLEYGNDPGALAFPDGYLVHKDSVIWDVLFRDAAMALENIGDISEPVVTDFGVHIIQYAGDAPSGAAPMTAEISETIREGLLNSARDEGFSAQLQAWLDEYDTEIHADLILLPEAQEAPEEDHDGHNHETADGPSLEVVPVG